MIVNAKIDGHTIPPDFATPGTDTYGDTKYEHALQSRMRVRRTEIMEGFVTLLGRAGVTL